MNCIHLDLKDISYSFKKYISESCKVARNVDHYIYKNEK